MNIETIKETAEIAKRNYCSGHGDVVGNDFVDRCLRRFGKLSTMPAMRVCYSLMTRELIRSITDPDLRQKEKAIFVAGCRSKCAV